MSWLFYCLSIIVPIHHASSVYSSQRPADSTNVRAGRHAVSLTLGTTGPGVQYRYTLDQKRRLTLRVGGQYVAYRQPIQVEASPGSYVVIHPDFMIGLLQGGVAWQPFRRGSFFVAASLAYTWHPGLGAVIRAEDKLMFGGLELTPENVGRIDLALRWKPVIGYVGWGFGRSIPRRRLGVGAEVGVYYLGRPRVRLQYEGFLETTTLDQQVAVVERNLAGYRYLPSVNLSVTYRLNRLHQP